MAKKKEDEKDALFPKFDEKEQECVDTETCALECPENPVIDECGGELDYNCDGKISCTSSATSGEGAEDGCGCRTGLPSGAGPASGVWLMLALLLSAAFLRRRVW